MFKECLIVEDQLMFAELLTEVFSASPLIGRIHVAKSVRSGLALVRQRRFDLVFLDLLLPDGPPLELVRELRAQKSAPKIVVVSAVSDPWQIREILPEPVDAVIDKGGELDGLERVLRKLAESVGFDKSGNGGGADVGRLSKRERDIFLRVGEGLANKEIAERLGISVHTVETHRKNIVRKMGLSGNHLVRAAVRFHENGGRARLR